MSDSVNGERTAHMLGGIPDMWPFATYLTSPIDSNDLTALFYGNAMAECLELDAVELFPTLGALWHGARGEEARQNASLVDPSVFGSLLGSIPCDTPWSKASNCFV